MELKIAKRKQAKIKLCLQGPSGSGKTLGALNLAYGLCQDWGKICVIDTEHYSASLYAHLGSYLILNLTAPFAPEKYVEAIQVCEKQGISVIIIDSISHEWDGIGGILDTHSGMVGNSFTNWSKLTPRHNLFVQAILQSPCHIIGTVRSKQEYVLTDKNGKQVPEKVGLKGITRDGMDYEFSLVFDLDSKHNATASKDRTGLFADKPEFKLAPEIGAKILEWCLEGEPQNEVEVRISGCRSLGELVQLYNSMPESHEQYQALFSKKKQQLSRETNFSNNFKLNGNGNSNH